MKGVYCLLLALGRDSRIDIGALGRIAFEKGHYVYIGSALNGLEGRIARHLRKEKKKHWHIDYLLSCRNARVKQVFAKQTCKRVECAIAGKIAAFGEPVPNFGCGDCKCKSHLFRVDREELEGAFKNFSLKFN